MPRITRLKILLLESDLPQYEIAGLTGIHPTTLSNYANGGKPMTTYHLRELCNFFEVGPEEVLGWEDVEFRE